MSKTSNTPSRAPASQPKRGGTHSASTGKSGRKKRNDGIVRQFNPLSKNSPFQFQEAFNSLRTNLKFVSMQSECKKIIVTSAIPGEGKSSVAINLAISLAADGSQVLLVDCDLRKPIVHKYLRIPHGASKGLTHVLQGQCNLADCVLSVTDLKIDVLIAGVIPPNPAEILGSRQMKDAINILGDIYDYIIFDTPPVSVVTDAAVLSQYVDGVIMVIQQDSTTFQQAKVAKQNLESVHANIIGTILNNYDIKSVDREDGHYYSYYYEYGD